jgi:hypothetical protein
MKISFSLSQILKSIAATALLVSVTSCASTGSLFRQADSTLPMQTFDSTGGEMANTRAFETSDRLYVAGGLNKRIGIPTAAHVDVQLVDANGKIIAEKQDDIALPYRHPRTSANRFRRPTYVASFPLSEARQASKIIVRYHRVPHGS